MNEPRLRQQLCQIAHQLWVRGLLVADTGLISIELHRRRYLATPPAARRAALEPDALVYVDLGGENAQGGPSIPPHEWRVHRLAYQAAAELDADAPRDEQASTIQASALTTPPHVMALMRTSRSPSLALNDEAAGEAGVLPIVEADDDAALKTALAHSSAVGVRGYGLLTVGPNLSTVANRAERIELAATIELALLRTTHETTAP